MAEKPLEKPENHGADREKIHAAAQKDSQALIGPEAVGIDRCEPQRQKEQQREQHVHRQSQAPPKPPERPAHIIQKSQKDSQARRDKEFHCLAADLLDHRNSRDRKPPCVAALS